MAKHEMEERFERFAMTLPGAESIDALKLDTGGGQRADYLWRDRSVVVEVKRLKGDPQDKVDRTIDELSKREDFPVHLGSAPVDKVLGQLPDGAELLRKLLQAAMRSVEAAFRDAKGQIANTKKLLGLDDALGVMVLLNPDIESLDPVNVGQEISKRIQKRQEADWAVDVVWLLSEAHFANDAHPCIVIEGDRVERFPWADEFVSQLNYRWAAFNNSRMLTSDAELLTQLPFQRKSERHTGPLTNQQRWEANYRANPYLAHLDDHAVRAFGHEAVMALKPFFLIGGPRKPMRELEPLLERWTHLLVEASTRGLDIRGMGL